MRTFFKASAQSGCTLNPLCTFLDGFINNAPANPEIGPALAQMERPLTLFHQKPCYFAKPAAPLLRYERHNRASLRGDAVDPTEIIAQRYERSCDPRTLNRHNGPKVPTAFSELAFSAFIRHIQERDFPLAMKHITVSKHCQ